MPLDCTFQDNPETLYQNPAFDRLKKFLLDDPRCSKGRNTRSGNFDPPRSRPQAKAITYDLIQINGLRLTRYIAFDIDSKRAGMAWIDAGLPRPTFIMINPRNEHAHYLYELTSQFHHHPDDPNYSRKTVRYINAIMAAHKQAMSEAGYKVDMSYRGLLIKNPWYCGWQVIPYDRAYSFEELRGSLTLPWCHHNTATATDTEIDPDGRNCTLFKRLRFWAYRSVRFYPNETAFEIGLNQQAHVFSQDFHNLIDFPEREIQAVVKSVCRWVWDRYCDGHYQTDDYRRKPKKLNLAADMELPERQLSGQQYTCDQRKSKTRDEILSAIQQLHSEGVAITKAAVARSTGKDRKTIRSHWSQIQVGQVTIETECPSDTSYLSGGCAAVWGIDTKDTQLPTPHVPETVPETAPPTGPQRVIRDTNDTPYRSPFIGWNEPIHDHVPKATTEPLMEGVKPLPPTRLPTVLPIETGPFYSSADVVGYEEYKRRVFETLPDHHPSREVKAIIEANYYAERMADRGIKIDGFPYGRTDTIKQRLNAFYQRQSDRPKWQPAGRKSRRRKPRHMGQPNVIVELAAD